MHPFLIWLNYTIIIPILSIILYKNMFLQNQNGKLNCNKLLLSCNSLQLSSKLIPIGSKFNPLINTQTTLRITAFYSAFHYTICYTIFAKNDDF